MIGRAHLGRIRDFFSSLIPERRETTALQTVLDAYDAGSAPPPVLYLGDSVVERVSDRDTDKTTLGDKVVRLIRGRGVEALCVTHSAYHVGVYLGLLKALQRTRHRPDLLIFPVNIRAFSPQWHLNPKWRFDEEIDALDRYVRGGEGFPSAVTVRGFRRKWREYLDTVVDYPGAGLRTVRQFKDVVNGRPTGEPAQRERRRLIFTFHYMFPLAADHPRLALLGDMLEFALSRGMRVLAYTTPVNHEGGRRYAGDGFGKALEFNLSRIRAVMGRHAVSGNLRFVDAATSLAPEFFFNEHESTEHLNQDGRDRIARLIDAAAGDMILSKRHA